MKSIDPRVKLRKCFNCQNYFTSPSTVKFRPDVYSAAVTTTHVSAPIKLRKTRKKRPRSVVIAEGRTRQFTSAVKTTRWKPNIANSTQKRQRKLTKSKILRIRKISKLVRNQLRWHCQLYATNELNGNFSRVSENLNKIKTELKIDSKSLWKSLWRKCSKSGFWKKIFSFHGWIIQTDKRCEKRQPVKIVNNSL